MSDCNLRTSTGYSEADRILQAIVGRYERAFPDCIRAYYLIGSYADGDTVPISDIDVAIVFARPLTPERLAQAHALAQQCAQDSPIRLDIGLTRERDLSSIEQVLLKLGGLFIYGDDVRHQLVLPPLALYQRDVTWSPYRFLGQVLRERQVLAYPLSYPDASDPFYGYTKKRIAPWYPAGVEQGTKEWITGVTRTATALLALRAHQYVGSKSASIRLYRERIADEWTEYLETLYHKGKGEWQYQVPDHAADRQQLRELCRQTLGFENHYFEHYRTYLLDLLQGTDDERRFAAERLTQVVYTDDLIAGMLEANAQATSAEVRAASMQALAQIARTHE
jgi:predicted nucleotidyltransferase